MTTKQQRDAIIMLIDPTLYNDPVMRATMGMNILKKDNNPTSNIFGAALMTSAFKDMDKSYLGER